MATNDDDATSAAGAAQDLRDEEEELLPRNSEEFILLPDAQPFVPPPLPQLLAWKCNPTLELCFSALESEQSLVDLLRQLLDQDFAHVNHLEDWFLFLFASILSTTRPMLKSSSMMGGESDFAQEKEWCESVLAQTSTNRVCPKAFTLGEIVWNCEECQRDSTCVLCVPCFQASNHEGHTVHFYQVSSASGGCCDCGDEGAWDPKGFCPDHGKSCAAASALDASQTAKLRLLFDFVVAWMLHACHALSQNLAQCTYTFSLGGMDALLGVDELEPHERTLEAGSGANIFISKTDLLAKRLCVLVDAWTLLLKSSDALVRVFVQSLTQGSVEDDALVQALFEDEELELLPHETRIGNSALEQLIALDPLLPSTNSRSFHALFMRLLSDILFKQHYAVAYAKTLVKTCEAACERITRGIDVQQHSMHEFGIFLLSIQFLNRPRFVNVLCRCFNLLGSIMQCLRLLLFVDGGTRYDSQALILRQRVYRYVLSDLKYLLQIEGISALFFERESALLVQWMGILQTVQNCDAEQRVPSHHDALDDTDEWMHSVFVILNLSLIFPYLDSWMISSRRALTPGTSKAIVAKCEDFILARTGRELVLAADEFSFHLPLYRFIALTLDFQLSVVDGGLGLSKQACFKLADASFKVLALSSMVGLGAWKRNGSGLENVNSNYERGAISFFTRDLDLRAVQLAMTELGAEECVQLAQQHFAVDQESGDYALGMDESLLQYMIALATEMPSAEGNFDWELHRLLVHRLAEGPQSLNALSELLLQWHRDMDCPKLFGDDEFLVQHLLQVANRKPHSDLQSALYELKPEMWIKYYDPSYYHQRRERREAVRELWSEARAKQQRKQQQEEEQSGRAESFLPICPKLNPNCHALFIPCRTALLRAVLPLATSALQRCAESTQVASSLTLVGVQLVTLCVYANIELGDELLDLLRRFVQTGAFDSVIMDSIQWIISKTSKAATVTEEGALPVGTAAAAASTTTTTLTAQDKMERKRLRAQERVMKAMRKATTAFEGEMGAGVETSAATAGGGGSASEEVHCTCLEEKGAHVPMGFLGLRQTSQVVLPNTEIVTMCGHAMHFECCSKWRNTPPSFTVHVSVEDKSRGEFLCPLCKAVCNTWVPFDRELGLAVFPPTTTTAAAVAEVEGDLTLELGPFQADYVSLQAATATEAAAPVEGEKSLFYTPPRQFPRDRFTVNAFIRDFEGSCTLFWLGALVTIFAHPSQSAGKIRNVLLTCVTLGVACLPNAIDKQDVDMSIPEVRFGVEYLFALCTARAPAPREFTHKLFVHCLGLKLIQLILESRREPVAGGVQAVQEGEEEEELQGDDVFFTSKLGVPRGASLAAVKRGLHQFIRFYLAITQQQEQLLESHPAWYARLFDNAPFYEELQRAATVMPPVPAPVFRIRQLITLPTDYTTLLLSCNLDQPCAKCHEVALHERGVCLLCGETLLAGAPCMINASGEGACTQHANERHGGVCIFFLVQRSVLLLLNRKKCTLYSSLYLDKHGEERGGHTGGLPMKLDARRLANVQAIFEQHRVPMEIASRSASMGFVVDNFF